MKPFQILMMAVWAIYASSCNQPSDAKISPVENIETAPAPPASDISVSGDDIIFLSGRGHLKIPAGWRQVVDSEFELEIEAADDSRWTRCHLINVDPPSPVPISPTTAKSFIERFWNSTVREIESEGQPVAVAYPALGENLLAKTVSFTSGEADLIMYAIFVVASHEVRHGVHISCEVTSPATTRDKTDVETFASSFRYNES